MDEYTPTTEQIRARYTAGDGDNTEWYESMFNRWLAAHYRVVAANAWDEGYDAGLGDARSPAPFETSNPYRITEENN